MAKIFCCKYKNECAESIPLSGKNCHQTDCIHHKYKTTDNYSLKEESLSEWKERQENSNGCVGFGFI